MTRRPFQTGDVFLAPDPYHDDDPLLERGDARPWLVVSTAAYPRQGEDYLCCALTSYADDHPELIRLSDGDWVVGAPRTPGQIDPLTLITVKHEWAGRYVGRVADAKVNRARRRVRGFL